ncbi:MAG TPA: alpha/beta hydrolase [Candidatus Methylomirabilis sp.]|nr:alpha/beta hydrolase [Candidatus Methylomirabilis sp.]
MHVILIHGWKGWPDNGWFPWLRKELEARGFTTEALALPNPVLPRKVVWATLVRDAIKSPETVLIGHSLGCLAILFALQEYDGPPIRHVVCASGFGRDFNVPGLYTWFDAPVDFAGVKMKARHWSVLHARNDRLVPYREGEWLAAELGVPVTVIDGKGHLTHEEKVFELPEALEAVISSS